MSYYKRIYEKCILEESRCTTTTIIERTARFAAPKRNKRGADESENQAKPEQNVSTGQTEDAVLALLACERAGVETLCCHLADEEHADSFALLLVLHIHPQLLSQVLCNYTPQP